MSQTPAGLEMDHASDASTEVPDLRRLVRQLEEEVQLLQHRLGELHGTEVNALRRAYRTLCQHVDALEKEADGVTGQLGELETDVVTPDLVANELGAATSVTIGLSVVHQALKVTPLEKVGWLFRGMWALGGAYVVWRLTAGTLTHVLGMLGRNSERKRQLAARLEAVEERIHIMASLLNWAEARPSPASTPSASTQALQQQPQQAQHAKQSQQAAGAGREAVTAAPTSGAGGLPVPAPPHLRAGKENAAPGTPRGAASPSSLPKASTALGPEGTGEPAAYSLQAEASQGAAGAAQQPLSDGASHTEGRMSHSRNSSHASLSGAVEEAGPSTAPAAAGAVSPGRAKAELPSELEGLRRYAQLGSPSGKASP